jgi:hypothetical protein
MSDLTLPDPTEWKQVVCNSHPENWAVYEVQGKKKKKLVLTATGPGGLADAIKHLKEDQIQFFGFRVTGLDKKGGVTSVRSKFIKVCWIGGLVGPMGRASVTVIMRAAMDFFDRCHLGFQVVGDIAELTEERIEAKLRASGGAHQVERYDFTNAEAPGANASPKVCACLPVWCVCVGRGGVGVAGGGVFVSCAGADIIYWLVVVAEPFARMPLPFHAASHLALTGLIGLVWLEDLPHLPKLSTAAALTGHAPIHVPSHRHTHV